MGGSDAVAVILHADAHVCAGPEIGMRERIALGKGAGGDGERNPAGAPAEGLPGVGAEVHQDLMNFRGVGGDGGDLGGQGDAQLGGGGDRGAQQAGDLLDDRGERGDAVAAGIGPAEGEEAADEVAGAEAGLVDAVDELDGGLVGGEIEARELHVAEDGGEDVVEIVGDPAGEGADGLEFLRLAQLFLEAGAFQLVAFAGGDVGGDADEPGLLRFGGVGEPVGFDLEPTHLGAGRELDVGELGGAACECRVEQLAELGGVRRIEAGGQGGGIVPERAAVDGFGFGRGEECA